MENQFKGTPGPWRRSTTVPEWITAGDKSSDICKISNHCGFDYLIGNDLANAQLIACAPELLEALIGLMKSAYPNYDLSKADNTTDSQHPADIAFRAINKATNTKQ